MTRNIVSYKRYIMMYAHHISIDTQFCINIVSLIYLLAYMMCGHFQRGSGTFICVFNKY
jgi:hypothetical protein